MKLDKPGTWNAYPVQIGVDETGPNNLATAIISFAIYEEKLQGEYVDVASEQLEIVSYYYLEKTNGELNDFAIKSLKEALGWDGIDPTWLSQEDLSEHPVQITTDWEEYQGKESMKVQWTNAYGSTGGGVSQGDDATQKRIQNRLGSKFRAHSPASAAPPKARKKAAKKPDKKAPAAANAELVDGCTADEAFEVVLAKFNPAWKQEDVNAEWFAVVEKVWPGGDVDQMTPVEWAKVRDEGPGHVTPF